MRTTIFLIALIAVSSVAATSFNKKIQTNADFKKLVDKTKTTNIGKMIMTLAQLHQGGQYAPLFDAIDDLKDFLADQLLQENGEYSKVTALWSANVDRLVAASADAYEQAANDNSELQSSYYPDRANLQADIVGLEDDIADLNEDLDVLDAARADQKAIYDDNSADYEAGILSLRESIPFLESLLNSGSFLEVHAEQFGAVAHDLKQKLGKLRYGSLYQSFVQALESTFQSGNLVDQEGLQEVIDLLNHLLDRLNAARQAWDDAEGVNADRYHDQRAQLEDTVAQSRDNLAAAQQELALLEVEIETTEDDEESSTEAGRRADSDLQGVQESYAARSAVHEDLLNQIAAEQNTIESALEVLASGGITRSS